MKKTTEVFHLVHSLSNAEKRFFKVFCGKSLPVDDGKDSDEHLFVQLFDDLKQFLKGKEIVEDGFENTFCSLNHGKPYMKSYSYYKGILLDRILDACLSMAENSIDQKLGRILDRARFLKDRRLPKSCLKRLDKAYKIATEYEKHEVLLEILRMKRTLLMEDKSVDSNDVLKVGQDLEAVSKVVEEKYIYLKVKDQLFLEQKKKSQERRPEHLQSLKQLIDESPMSNGKMPLSFDAKHSYYFAQAIYAQLTGDMKKAWEYHTEIFHLWKNAPHIQYDRQANFRNAMNNYLNLCCYCEEYQHFEEALAYMENPEFHSEDERIDTLQNSLFIRMTHAINRCNWPEVNEVIKAYNAKKVIIENKIHTSRIMAFYLHFAWYAFVNQHYKDASSWIDEILKLGKPGTRNDISNFGRLFKPIIRISQGLNTVLESDTRSAYRKLKDESGILPYERALIQYYNQFADLEGTNKEIEESQKLMHLLEDLAKASTTQNALGYEIFIRWLESRVRKMDLRAVVEEKWLARF